ncbi:MAG: AI-2E family transporter [Oscillospiraceae bacterium]|nr:AI-2E family transporter [Oscillospiraceae bacterium]
MIVVGAIVLYWILNETERFSAVWNTVTGILSPFILGATLAFILNVPMRGIEANLDIKSPGIRRAVAMALTFVVMVAVICAVFLLVIPQISATIRILVPKIVAFFAMVEEKIVAFLAANPQLLEMVSANIDLDSIDLSGLIQKVMDVLGNSVSNLASHAFTLVGGITGAVVDGVIGIVFALYCLARKDILAVQGKKLLYALLPQRFCDETVRILRLTNRTFSSFISGQCLEACILGGLFAVSMAILKMPYITLISVLIGVTSLVPLVGAFVGCILGAFFILVNDPMQAVWFIVMFLVVQQIEGNLIYPRVVGNSIGLPGMWVLVAVTVGGDLMGVGGMLLMIPLTSVLYTLLREFTNNRLAVRNVPREKYQDVPAAPEPEHDTAAEEME